MNGDTPMQYKMLNDIAKMAALKATSALSKMLDFPIGVDIFPIQTKILSDINFIMGSGERIAGMSLPIVGPLPGVFLLIFKEAGAYSICDAMFHRDDGATQKFGEMEVSALTEVANIVVGNFLTSFAFPLKIDSLMHRAAHFCQDDFTSFMEETTSALDKKITEGMVVEIAFHFQHVKIQGLAVFLFDEKEIAKIIDRVKV